MKIGILGTGTMGAALGRLLIKKGHTLAFGSHDPAKAAGLAAATGVNARGGTYREAAGFGDLMVLATRWEFSAAVLRDAGPLQSRILMDCTNPEALDGRDLAIGHTTSGAEAIAEWTGARVVKAFNHVYAEVLDTGPSFGAEAASVFYCGNDGAAKETVAALIRESGYDPVDAGPLESARYLEPMAALMIELVRGQNLGPSNVVLKLLRRKS